MRKLLPQSSNRNQKTICLCWTIIIWLTTISQVFIEGLRTLDKTQFGPEPRGTFKTIEVPEDGDIIDCVDIYKQPALNDPLIKKDFQMAPSKAYISLYNRTKNPLSKILQNWRRYGECPKGTIPIRRTWNNNGTIQRKTYNENFKHEFAIGHHLGRIQGARANINLWKPRVVGNEYSKSFVWLSSLTPVKNTIESGWIVYPHRYGQSWEPRLFIFWKNANRPAGCYDVNDNCVGFVQTSQLWALGGAIMGTSQFYGVQIHLQIALAKDPQTRKWWLQVEGTRVGYFPPSLVPSLENGATGTEFGGEIINSKPNNRHTSTHMGSGRPARDGNGQASYISNIKVLNNQFETVDTNIHKIVTRAECYDLDLRQFTTEFGVHFYYGGPGYSQECYEG